MSSKEISSTVLRSSFAPKLADLPSVLPLFPLENTLLLPDGRLPLTVFEDRYLAMIRDSLADANRMLGVIQPISEKEDRSLYLPLKQVGCAGRIVSFNEHEDTYVIILEGVCRFSLGEEIQPKANYRRAKVNWDKFLADLYPSKEDHLNLDRRLLEKNLREYLTRKGLVANWDAIGAADNLALITALSMLCPFSPEEKQALLEVEGGPQLAQMLATLLEMGLHEETRSEQKH